MIDHGEAASRNPTDPTRLACTKINAKPFFVMAREAWKRLSADDRKGQGLQRSGVVMIEGVPYVLLSRIAGLQRDRAAWPLGEPSPVDLLTARELQIAQLITQGEYDKTIAYKLGISEYTVREHLRRIFHKLHVTKRTALVSFMYRHRITD